MSTCAGRFMDGRVRRLSSGVEMQAGVAPGGWMQRVLDKCDLLLLVEHPGARVHCRHRVDPLPPALLALSDAGEVLSLELPEPSRFCALRVAPGLLAAAAGHRAPSAGASALPSGCWPRADARCAFPRTSACSTP